MKAAEPITSSVGQKRKQPSADTDPTTTTTTDGDASVGVNSGQGRQALNWEEMKSKIMVGMSTDLPSACTAIAELRDNFELVHSTEYPTMLSTLLPVFVSILKTVPCTPSRQAYVSRLPGHRHENDEHAGEQEETEKPEFLIRHAILEICTRLPQNEVLRPYAGSLLELAMGALHTDYENNALLAARIVFELHKSFRPMLSDYVQPFLDFVRVSYRSLPKSVQRNFMIPAKSATPAATSIPTPPASISGEYVPGAAPPASAPAPSLSQEDLNQYLVKSTASFRVLTECPLSVMLLFQLYPKYIKSNLLQLLPLMMEALAQRPPLHATALLCPDPSPSKSSSVKESKETIALKALFRQRSRELLTAQVKTLSFVTHLLRGYGEHIKPYEDRLATNVLSLFQMCPREALATRKDLLIALRHIFSTNFRKGFFRHVDTLLDERLLIGKHRQSEHAHLRAAAYSALADLLLHVRPRLSMAQVSRVVHLYSRVLHDASMNLPLVVQTASVRLLLNMVDPVYHNKEEKASLGRDILFRILETLVWKLGMLVDHGIANVRAAEQRSNGLLDATKKGQRDESLENDNCEKSVPSEEEIREFMYGAQLAESPGTIQNIRELIKPLLPGIKTLIWCINNYGTQREKITANKDKSADAKSKSNSDHASRQRLWYEELAAQSINVAERSLIEKYFVWTLEALKVFKETPHPGNTETEKVDTKEPTNEYHDALENFASSLSVLDSSNFQRIVGPQMRLLVDSIIDDEDILVVPKTFLLQNLNITSDFAACLLQTLMEDANALDIGVAESDDEKIQRAADMKMTLFSTIFSSLSLCPKNEKVLRPYLQQLIAACLRRAMGSDVKFWPGNHFKILRQLFRAIAGGKFEESYKEILPLLPTLLNGLYRVYCNTNHDILKKVIIELCLTIPARLSSLLPHLSLLLRIIVPALQTNDGDLINLGLRTLEFWVDNLNTEFLFPILSQDETLFADLMTTLSTHLRPAPYQYGLLTLRLLGKLGGKNRTFLRAPMLLSTDSPSNNGDFLPSIECSWKQKEDTNSFSLQIPLRRAMAVLEKVSMVPSDKFVAASSISGLDHIQTLLEVEHNFEESDLSLLKDELLCKTLSEQANAAYAVVRGAIRVILDIKGEARSGDDFVSLHKGEIQEDSMNENKGESNNTKSAVNDMYVNFLNSLCKGDSMLKYIFKALFYSTNIDGLCDDASILLEGLMKHIIFALASYPDCVRREDDVEQIAIQKDSSKQENTEKHNNMAERPAVVQNGKLQPLLPFGRFIFVGGLKSDVSYFIFNEVLAEVLLSREKHLISKALGLISKLMETVKQSEVTTKSEENEKDAMDAGDEKDDDMNLSNLCAENLLSEFCQTCLSCKWESRCGIYEGICLLLESMDQDWCRLFEVELFHVAIFCMKDNPLEAALAQKEALVFYTRLLVLLYIKRDPGSSSSNVDHKFLESTNSSGPSAGKEAALRGNRFPHSDAIPTMLITELASNKTIVRFAARYGLEFLYDKEEKDNPHTLEEIISKHGSIIKRHLFSKSLRNLQLEDQIATIETFAYIVKNAPGSAPLSDSHVLVFLSESLKMMSVADGEMTSESISSSVIINKDGFSPRVARNSCMVNKFSSLTHATGIFLREGFEVIFEDSGQRVLVKPELPIGVQLRVSSLHLFHEVLKRHSDYFLEAESSSSVGNILPHIVSLLFRSLTSQPEDAVDAAYGALKEILSLSAKSKDGESQSTHRLPKTLLQMCIRPVLLNLRDYTKLTVSLLRGLSRLLSLLSTWFSKTLGEKLLKHLQEWADPEKIVSQRIWKQGEEPLVAAEILNLFQLLPDESSNFVEPLIKTTLKLETVLPRYSAFFAETPFRVPLAKYLNNHGPAVALFFINEHRFKNPIYSELLQDIARRKESRDIRKHLGSSDCSNMLLNVCFERPLSIIRSEKGAASSSSRSQPANSPRTAVDTLSMHGINIDLSSKKQALQQEIKLKQDKLQAAKREETKAGENLQKRANDLTSTNPTEKRLAVTAQGRLAKARALVENLQKEVSALQADYTKKFAMSKGPSGDESDQSPKSMTLDSLELQYQGFYLIETLISNDDKYISEHHDVVRAFRWLWRSKGRHFRLLHEDAISPRYNGESKYLARFLVNYSKTAPHDVDVLFDLLRIFLQPTSADFSFVQDYLGDTVCNGISLAQKRLVMQRFFPVIASEGIEELKVLSIQLLVLPMLKNDFERTSALSERSTCIAEDLKAASDECKEDTAMQVEAESSIDEKILNKELTSKFVAEVLVNGSEHRAYGSRLSIELLKLCSLLLDCMGKELGQHQQTVIRFAWNVLKSEDSKAKQWAYITICKFIVMFDSPPRITLQIYVSLLKSHQQETRDVVTTALDILIPALPSKLSADTYSNAIKATVNVLFEEGNSVPQLSHLWHTIVRHKHIFSEYRDRFMPHLVSSLNKLGLPMNSSVENRELSLKLIELTLEWDQAKLQSLEPAMSPKVSPNTMDLSTDSSIFKGLSSPESSPSKRMKSMGLSTAIFPAIHYGRRYCTLDQSEINTVVNFLVRLVLLVAVADKSLESLEKKAVELFQKVVCRWTIFEVRMEYFEKVITMCMNENRQSDNEEGSIEEGKSGIENKTDKKEKTSPRSRGTQTSTQKAKKSDDSGIVSDLLLSSCLEIFSSMLRDAPQNLFLQSGADRLGHLMKSCFKRASSEKVNTLRRNLKSFLVVLYSQDGQSKLQGMCKTLLEDLIFSATGSIADNPDSGARSRSSDVTMFGVTVVKGIVDANPQFLQSFTNIVISVAEKISKHLPAVGMKGRSAAKSSYKSASPLETLFENACLDTKNTYSMKASKSQNSKNAPKSVNSDINRDTLMLCLHFLGKGDVPFHFTSNRKILLSMLGDILDSGTDIEILLIVTSQVGKWVLAMHKKSPLTRMETKHFMRKLTTLESRGLPEIDAGPLHHLISLIALNFQTSQDRMDWMKKDEEVPSDNEKANSDESLKTLDQILHRISSGCLMSSDTSIRQSFCRLLLSNSASELIDVGNKLKDSRNEVAILDQSPTDALRILLCCDFEGLGYRMWTFVFVDVLLGICDHSGDINRSESMKAFHISPAPTLCSGESGKEDKGIFLDKVYSDFLRILKQEECAGQSGQATMLTATRILSSCDQTLCQELLLGLLNEAWARFPNNEERFKMVRHIETLLNRPYHAQFLKSERTSENCLRATNGIKSFLQAIITLKPLPAISIDLLMSLASNYNCWHEVRSMLEMQIIALEKLPAGTGGSYRASLESAVRRCYLELGEEDVWMALKAEACTLPELQYAGSLDMYSRVCEALKAYDSLIDQCENAHSNSNKKLPSDMEMSFIEDRWIALQRETCQWAVLSDLAEDSGFSKLMMECAWKNRDWEKLRTLCNSPAAVSALELGDIDVKMSEIFLAIYDGKLNEIENLHAQTAQLCLYKWQLLPPVSAGCNAHVALLRNFNRLVDIRESGQIMVEASQYTSGKSYPDLKNLLNAWRNRLPNDDEPISAWDDIFQWRSHMFNAITNKFQWAEQGTLASLHDRPWTAIRMARTARQQGIPEVSLLSLGKLTECAMDVADAFSKLNEQILSYRKGSDDEKKGGLNLINTTNLLFFDSRQKSELFRLKAEFLESLGGKTKATQAYCHAVQLCPTYARAWTSWGGLCWSLADLVETQIRRQVTSNSSEDEKKASNVKKVCQYLAQSMGCYLEAVHCDSSEENRMHLPRCLVMLAKDGASPGLLCSTFEKYAPTLPSWIWLPWIPQLLSSLCRTESRSAKILLHGILSSYPQAAYFSLRSFYLERRDQERSNKASSSGNTSGCTSVSYAEELMSSLRKSQPTLWVSLESILEELIIRFRPSYEEELLATITTLLQKAVTQLEHQTRSESGKESDQEAVRASFSKTLARVSAKFFHSQPDPSSASKDDRAKRTADFTLRYKESFERDFSMLDKEKKESNLSLDEIISKLKKWKSILECRVSSTPPHLPLMQVSPSLSAFSNVPPDLWSGACDTQGTSSAARRRKNTDADKDTSPSSSASAALKAAITAATAVSSANLYEGGGGSKGSGSISVEIPGQYSPNVGKDDKPTPELHAKLLKFESMVEVSRRNDQLVRRIGMLGSDGRVHQFLLQFAIPYWTRTDGRTAQLHQLLGKCLRKEAVACRRNLWLRPTAVIPIAQRLRMTAEEASHISLDDIYAMDCQKNGKDYGDAFSYIQNKMKTVRNSPGAATKEDSDNKDETNQMRIEAFSDICDNVISSRILADYVQSQFQSTEKYFQFQRTFASQTALNSLLQYAFGVSERMPSKFIFNNRNAHVLSPDFRFSYSNQGFIDEKKAVPFRLTRNIEEFIGPFLMKGIFTPAMASGATAICNNESSLEQALQLLCRDDIVSWYLSKSSQREGSQRSTQELERQLADRVKKNLHLIQSRFRYCVVKSAKVEQPEMTCDTGVRKLITLATSPENLVAMPSNYAAWL